MANITALVDILNGIRTSGSAEYQNYVPLATQANLEAVGNPILTYTLVRNEFINNLINKVGLTIVRHKLLTNPLAPMKKGDLPLGQDVEEIQINRAIAKTFDPTGADLLKRETSDVAVMYHRLNRRDMYHVTVSKDQLRTAFTSWESLNALISGIVSSMYDGDADDEFILMKNLVAEAIVNEHIVTTEIPDLRNADGTVNTGANTAIVEAFKNTATFMGFAGSNFNKFHIVNPGTEDEPTPPRRLRTDPEDMVLLIRADVATSLDVNVLANAFNLSKAEFIANRIIVDNFGVAENVGAVLVDKNFFQVYDQLRETEEFYNGAGLYWNYFYHVWQVMSYSLLVNAIAFVFPVEEEPTP